jgi:hypothetical protein
MQPSTYQRALAISGIVAAVLIAVAVVLSGDRPDDSQTAAKALNYWNDHQTQEIASALIVHAAAVLMVFFGAGLRTALRSGEAEEATYSVVAFGGAVLTAAGFVIAGMLGLAAATAADHGGEQAVYTINQISAVDWIPFTAGLSVLMLAAGVGGLRTLALPSWMSWVAIVLGVAFFTPVGAFGFLLVPFWVIAVSVVLYRRSEGVASPTPLPSPAA